MHFDKPRLSAMVLISLMGGLLTEQGQATEINFSGFADFTAGDVLGGSQNGKSSFNYLNYKCPCFISNYEYAGIYQNKGWNAANESMVGLQANAKVDDKLSAVLQIDARGLNGYQPSVDWAYASYQLTNTFTVQAGHKRLPLYMYSDYNYVGYAFPWVRPPVDLYGWEIYSYDGANVQYNNAFGDWAIATNTWAGNQSSPNAPGLTNVYNGYTTDTSWRDIIGTSIDISNDYVHLRGVYMQNKVFQGTPNPGIPSTQTAGTPDTPLFPSNNEQQIWGAAFNVDYMNMLWRSEYNFVRRPQMGYIAPSYLTGAGYKWDDVTALYTYSKYWEGTTSTTYQPQRDNTRSFTLRWDFRPSAALKVQYDLFKDHSLYSFMGNSKLLTVALDFVF